MWQVTWIQHGVKGPNVASITTPVAQVAWTVYWALRTQRWNVRVWSPSKELVA